MYCQSYAIINLKVQLFYHPLPNSLTIQSTDPSQSSGIDSSITAAIVASGEPGSPHAGSEVAANPVPLLNPQQLNISSGLDENKNIRYKSLHFFKSYYFLLSLLLPPHPIPSHCNSTAAAAEAAGAAQPAAAARCPGAQPRPRTSGRRSATASGGSGPRSAPSGGGPVRPGATTTA